jgi:hypothetical protein
MRGLLDAMIGLPCLYFNRIVYMIRGVRGSGFSVQGFASAVPLAEAEDQNQELKTLNPEP